MLRTIAVVNECMSRELKAGNWHAYTILADLHRDLLEISRQYGYDIARGCL